MGTVTGIEALAPPPAPPPETFTVSEAAARVGLTTHTLRWYESEGLIDPVGRDWAGRRRYTHRDIGRITLLLRLRRTGMPVRDMKTFADLVRRGESTQDARHDLLLAHRERVLARMAELEEDLKVIDHKIALYHPCGEES